MANVPVLPVLQKSQTGSRKKNKFGGKGRVIKDEDTNYFDVDAFYRVHDVSVCASLWGGA